MPKIKVASNWQLMHFEATLFRACDQSCSINLLPKTSFACLLFTAVFSIWHFNYDSVNEINDCLRRKTTPYIIGNNYILESTTMHIQMAITDGFKVFLQILTQVHVSNNCFTSMHTPEYKVVHDFYKNYGGSCSYTLQNKMIHWNLCSQNLQPPKTAKS